jgi:hypothetical protein
MTIAFRIGPSADLENIAIVGEYSRGASPKTVPARKRPVFTPNVHSSLYYVTRAHRKILNQVQNGEDDPLGPDPYAAAGR